MFPAKGQPHIPPLLPNGAVPKISSRAPSQTFFCRPVHIPVIGMCICSQEENAVIDRVMGCRHSHRQFNKEVPAEDDIRRILHAGLLAPFAAATVGNSTDYFRRFFVMKIESKSMNATSPLIFKQIGVMAKDLKTEMEKKPEIRTLAASFSQRLDTIQKMGRVPGIGTAPYLYRCRGTQRLSVRGVAVSCALHGKYVAESNGSRAGVSDLSR